MKKVAILVLFCFIALPAWGTTLSGLVDEAMKTKALQAIAAGERTVDLHTPGGFSAIGFQIGEAFAAASITVRCIGICGSAGANILIASQRCTISPQGRIGLHRPFTPGINDRLNDVMAAAYAEKLEMYGVPQDIAKRAISSSNVWFPSDRNMRRMGCEVQ